MSTRITLIPTTFGFALIGLFAVTACATDSSPGFIDDGVHTSIPADTTTDEVPSPATNR